MGLLTTHAEIEELGGGLCRQTIGLRAIAYPWQGGLRRITDLVLNTGDPALPLGVDELVQFRVRNRLSGGPVLHFGKGSSHVRITPRGTNNVSGVVGLHGVTYADAWNGADLRLTIAGHRLQKDILLKSGHLGSFSFRIDEGQNFDLDTLQSAEFRILDPVLIAPGGAERIGLAWVKSRVSGKRVLTVNLPAGDYAGWTLDPTITLQPDGTDGIDAYFQSNSASSGTDDHLRVGEHKDFADIVMRSAIRFDLSSLPAAAVISSATLSTWINSDVSSNARTFRLYRLLRAWVETQVTWSVYSTGNAWQTQGGFGALDCEQSAVGSCAFGASDAAGTQKDFVLTPTSKAALDAGNGWLIKADTELDDGYYLRSSDHATAANRPKLVVVYTVPSAGFLRSPMWGRYH